MKKPELDPTLENQPGSGSGSGSNLQEKVTDPDPTVKENPVADPTLENSPVPGPTL